MKYLVMLYMLTLCIALAVASYRPPPRNCVSFVKEHIGRMYAEITSLTTKVTNLEAGVSGLEEEVDELKLQVAQEDPLSAFALYGNFLDTTSPMEVVKFHGIQLNIGEDYSKDTGLFTCEHPGTYVFELDVVKKPNSVGVQCQIMKNDDILAAAAVATNTDDGAYYGSSVSTVAQLEQGDEVRVTCTNSNVSSQSAFSGFLLRAD